MGLSIGFHDGKMTAIYELLYQMGVGPSRMCFYYTACAARLAVENPENLLLITKKIYPEVSRRCGAKQHTIEHGIRCVINRIWTKYPEAFSVQLDADLTKRPTPTEFIIMLARKVEFPLVS